MAYADRVARVPICGIPIAIKFNGHKKEIEERERGEYERAQYLDERALDLLIRNFWSACPGCTVERLLQECQRVGGIEDDVLTLENTGIQSIWWNAKDKQLEMWLTPHIPLQKWRENGHDYLEFERGEISVRWREEDGKLVLESASMHDGMTYMHIPDIDFTEDLIRTLQS